jgi:hypothetical protein
MNRRFVGWSASIAAVVGVCLFGSAATLAGARGAFGTQGDGTPQFRTAAQ